MKGGCKNLATIRLVTGKEPGRNGALHDIKLTFVANESMNNYKGLKVETFLCHEFLRINHIKLNLETSGKLVIRKDFNTLLLYYESLFTLHLYKVRKTRKLFKKNAKLKKRY